MPVVWKQNSFRFRYDNGSETTATWMWDANTSGTLGVSYGGTANFRLRIQVTETGSTAGALTARLYVQKNGAGGYVQTSATATIGVRVVDSANLTDDDPTTNLLTGTPFVAGKLDDDDGMCAATGSIAKSSYTEHEYMLQIVDANVAQGDYFDFEEYNSTSALGNYAAVPRITAQKIAVGGLARTQAGNGLSAAGGAPPATSEGSLSQAQDDNSIASAAGLKIQGASVQPQADNAISAVGTLKIQASESQTQADNTSAFAGALSIRGALVSVQADAALASDGSGVVSSSGALSVTQESAAVSSVGALKIVANASNSQGDTLASAGQLVTAGASVGVLNLSQADGTILAAGAIAIRASGDVVSGADILNAAAQFIPPITGGLNVTQEFQSLSSVNVGPARVYPPPMPSPDLTYFHAVREQQDFDLELFLDRSDYG